MQINLDDFINGFEFGEQENCEITVQLGNQIIQKLSVALMIAPMQFGQLIQQVSKDDRPIKITCTRKEYTEEGKVLNNSLAFENRKFVEAFGGKENK